MRDLDDVILALDCTILMLFISWILLFLQPWVDFGLWVHLFLAGALVVFWYRMVLAKDL